MELNGTKNKKERKQKRDKPVIWALKDRESVKSEKRVSMEVEKSFWNCCKWHCPFRRVTKLVEETVSGDSFVVQNPIFAFYISLVGSTCMTHVDGTWSLFFFEVPSSNLSWYNPMIHETSYVITFLNMSRFFFFLSMLNMSRWEKFLAQLIKRKDFYSPMTSD